MTITLKDLLASGQRIRDTERELKNLKLDKEAQRKLDSSNFDAMVAKLQEQLQWQAVAICHQFEQQTCDCCGGVQTTLLGTFVEQTHRKDATATRKLRLVSTHPELPIKRDVWRSHVSMCYNCMEESQ